MQPGQECVPCRGEDYVAISLLAALGLLLTGALHILLTIDWMKESCSGRLLGAAFCVSQLITCAQLFSVIEQIQGITWTEPFLSFLRFFGILSLQTFLESVKMVGCVARITSDTEFLIRTLVVPLLFTIGPVFAHLVMVKLRLARGSGVLVQTFGFLMQLFFISLCSSFVEPFRCNVHPNGLLTMQTAHDVVCNFSNTHLSLCWMSGLVCLFPLSFLVLCIWVLFVVLPGRAQAADAAFVRACSFLILRFKPGYESFTIAFLMRNLLFVLAPMMQLASLVVMGILLVAVAVSVAYFKPWRSELSTQLDVLMNCVLLVLLLLGALTVDFAASDLNGLMILCTVCGCCLTFAIVFAAIYSVVKHIASKFRKKYAFFLSHQKTASSGFARLLKMELKRCGYTSFIDADDLTDLSRLFFYVTNDTKTFVLLATPQVLERKWCAGELAMAKLANVDTLLLRFPGFAFPDEDFIRNYNRLVPDFSELVQYGIGFSDVQETFRWLKTVESYDVGSKLSKQSLAGVVTRLTKESSLVPVGSPGSMTSYAILADPENMEAVATADVFGRFMVAIIPEKGISPLVLDMDDDVSRTACYMVFKFCMKCRSNVRFQADCLQIWINLNTALKRLQ